MCVYVFLCLCVSMCISVFVSVIFTGVCLSVYDFEFVLFVYVYSWLCEFECVIDICAFPFVGRVHVCMCCMFSRGYKGRYREAFFMARFPDLRGRFSKLTCIDFTKCLHYLPIKEPNQSSLE